MTEQLALDLDLAPTWSAPDHRPPCSECGGPALANVLGFTWYEPRRSFVSTGPRSPACVRCLDVVTATVRTETLALDLPGLLIVWSLIHQPGQPDATLPGSPFAWLELERVEP